MAHRVCTPSSSQKCAATSTKTLVPLRHRAARVLSQRAPLQPTGHVGLRRCGRATEGVRERPGKDAREHDSEARGKEAAEKSKSKDEGVGGSGSRAAGKEAAADVEEALTG